MKKISTKIATVLCILSLALIGLPKIVMAEDPSSTEPPTQIEEQQSEEESKTIESISFEMNSDSFTYTGSPICPEISNVIAKASDESETSLPSDAYSVSYAENVNAGQGSVTVEGNEGTPYAGFSQTMEFTIAPADIDMSSVHVSLSTNSYTYNGKEKTPAVSLKRDGTSLIKNKDYTVSYSDNVNAGTAKVTITGQGNYTGIRTKSYIINQKEQNVKVKIKSPKVKLRKTRKISVTGAKGSIMYQSSNKKIATVSQKGVVKGVCPGKATITIKIAGTRNYKPFTKKIKIQVTGKKMTKKNTKIKLHRKTYTYNKKAHRPDVTVKYKKKKLKRGRDFGVRYRNNINAGKGKVIIIGKGNYYGKFTKSITIKKANNPVKISLKDKYLDIGEKSSFTIKKKIGTIKYKIVSGSKYISLSDSGTITGKKRGKAQIKVTDTGNQNYKKKSKTFTVYVGSIEITDSDISITLAPKNIEYNGTERKPSVTIKNGKEKLKEGTDYTLSYENNINVGTAKVIIQGKGFYRGSRTVTFNITKAEQRGVQILLDKEYVPLNGTAQLSVENAHGTPTFVSNSPTYVEHLGNGKLKGLKETKNYVTITITVPGDENYKKATFTKKVSVKAE